MERSKSLKRLTSLRYGWHQFPSREHECIQAWRIHGGDGMWRSMSLKAWFLNDAYVHEKKECSEMMFYAHVVMIWWWKQFLYGELKSCMGGEVILCWVGCYRFIREMRMSKIMQFHWNIGPSFRIYAWKYMIWVRRYTWLHAKIWSKDLIKPP